MANIDTLKGKLTAIANAIRQKTGRSALLDLDEMPTEILSIDGGGDAPNPDDPLLLVNWDGTLLYSYTYEDAQQISEFPDPPTHEGLTFQSWNWSEVVAKTWLQNHRGTQLRVGATYTPTDGQDHNYWRSSRLSEPDQIYMQHRATTSVGDNEFYERRFLTSISLPNGLTSIATNTFQNCYSLISINLSNRLTTISGYAFAYCYSIPKIDIPASVTLIGSYAFNNCTSLVDVVIRGTPALGGSVVFDSNPSNQRFYVHRSDLSWFSTATNWSAIYGEGKIVAAADHIEYLQSIGIDTTDFEEE